MQKTNKLAVALSELSQGRMEELAQTLVWLDSAQAERIKNAIMVAQQEEDMKLLEREKQFEMMSYEEQV
jgi:hypothetical protein